MSKTKICGYLMILSAAVSVAIDGLNGGGFDLMGHYNALTAALTGAGLINLRSAVAKAK